MKVERLRYDSHSEVRPILLVGPVKDIGTGSSDFSGDQLYTTGASSCVVMAAHNTATNEGMIGHFTSIATQHGRVTATWAGSQIFLNAVNNLPKLGAPEETEIWLGAGMPLLRRGQDIVEPDKFQAAKMISKYLGRLGLSESLLQTDWSDKERAIDVELDCALGLLVVHDYPTRLKTWDEAVEKHRVSQRS
jgi:hypothetical protein